MKTLLPALAILHVAAFHVGCGNPCDDAVDRANECGVEFDESQIDTDRCAEADECVAACYVDASCETLRLESMQGSLDFQACAAECP